MCVCVCVCFLFLFLPVFVCLLIEPSPPQNLTVLEVTSTTIKLTWREPEKANGAIHGYRVYYIHQNQTDLHMPILKLNEMQNSVYHYTLSNLSKCPYTG